MEILALVLAFTFILAGFVGIFVPYLPDAPLVVVGIFIYWIIIGFQGISIWIMIVQLLCMGIVVVADFLAGAYAVKRFGGSRLAQIFSFVGGLIGLIVSGILGLIIGTLLGAIIGELVNKGDIKKSIKIGFATALGFLGGILFKIIMLVLMSGLFVATVIYAI